MIAMKTAKTIEELYKEAKEFDVVITVDAALATALNARVDEPDSPPRRKRWRP